MSSLNLRDKLWGDTEEFENILSSLDDKNKALAEKFYTDGYIKLENVVAADLIDQAISEYDHWCNDHQKDAIGTRDDNHIPRIVNLHGELDIYKSLVTRSKDIFDVTDLLFGHTTSVYTSLTFQYGTEQPLYRDTPVFRTSPERFYFGVWIALEDANHENGCLNILPGAHHGCEVCQYEWLAKNFPSLTTVEPSGKEVWAKYLNEIVKKCLSEGFSATHIEAKKGDVIVWHPQLPHGGSKILNTTKTRRSVVFHVVPERVPVYQADAFFDKSRINESTETKRKYYTFEGREFMRTSPPSFGAN